jgi:hypothetical protein
MPHEEGGIAFCPKFCEYKDVFWRGVTHFHPEFHCELDETITEAVLIFQENFTFDSPPSIDAGQLRDIIQRWLETTPVLGIGYPSVVERPEPYDLYTKVEAVVLTGETAQIYFKRICPVWFILGFIKKCFPTDKNFFDTFVKYLPKNIDRLQARYGKEMASYKPQSIDENVDGIIAHFRWEPKKYKGIVPREYFKGMMLPYEAEIQRRKFLDFIKTRFPDWRHLE